MVLSLKLVDVKSSSNGRILGFVIELLLIDGKLKMIICEVN